MATFYARENNLLPPHTQHCQCRTEHCIFSLPAKTPDFIIVLFARGKSNPLRTSVCVLGEAQQLPHRISVLASGRAAVLASPEGFSAGGESLEAPPRDGPSAGTLDSSPPTRATALGNLGAVG